MIPLIASIWHALLHDELAARRWLRGLANGVALMLVQVMVVGPDVAATWTHRQWGMHLLASSAGVIAGLISVGEKNEKPGRIAGQDP